MAAVGSERRPYCDEAAPVELRTSSPGSFNVKLRANGDLIGQRAFVLVPA
jgi:hypothetical protein